jgi:hypothetical protein
MNFIPKLQEFGTVNLLKIYHQYDIPRTFLVSTKILGLCVVIWFDENESYDSWYYAPVNDEEIERLERGYVQLRDVFCHKELYEIRTGHCETVKCSFNRLSPSEVDQDALPPPGFAVKVIGEDIFDIEQRKPDSFALDSNSHEIRISRPGSNKLIEWEPIEFIFGAWKRLHNNILQTVQNISEDVSAFPDVATTGSYKMQFRSSHNNDVYEGVKKVFDAVKCADGSLDKLKELNVDLSVLEELLLNLIEFNLKFEIRTNSGALIESLNYKLVKKTIHSLNEYNQHIISSDLIPQANEIDRIITYVKNKSKGQPFTSETENITTRQIDYYKSASDMLGLSNRGTLTPIGWRLSELENEIEIYKILLDRFETSECGWAWLKYAGVRSVLELDPYSAEDFLRRYSTGLSESTIVRRASTLRKWPLAFERKLSRSR